MSAAARAKIGAAAKARWARVRREKAGSAKSSASAPKKKRNLSPEGRAKIVAAEGEFQAAVKLGEAADIISQHPVALQLRTLQTMAEISVEKNSTIIFPAQFMTTVQEAIKMIRGDGAV